MMVTCYPGGSSAYGPHIDNVDGDGRTELDLGRCFALVYYLNYEWDEVSNGGALRVHSLPGSSVSATDIPPRGDTLVMFRADRLVHEVRPAHKSRLAVGMWLYGGNEKQAMKAKDREV